MNLLGRKKDNTPPEAGNGSTVAEVSADDPSVQPRHGPQGQADPQAQPDARPRSGGPRADDVR